MKRPHAARVRVLLAHNFYRSSAPSGEDEVVRSEQKLLESNGIEVIPFERHNDDLPEGLRGAVAASLSNAWSFRAARDLRDLISRTRPDVAHFHNTFPQISPAAYDACRAAGVPVVQTLHNYRMFCANGLLNRAGAACESCVGRAPLPALLHGCYRDSRLATAGMVLGTSLHRMLGTYQSKVDQFIALTRFAAQRFAAHGIPQERVIVRGNCLPMDPGVGDGGSNDDGYALFVGRLTAEKGVRTLVRAWSRVAGIPLKIAGDGELRPQLEREAANLSIEFLGRVPMERIFDLMRGARMLVIPSEWYEGFPRVIVEAFATGTPVVAADIGGLRELIEDDNGVRFAPGSVDGLASSVARLWRSPEALAQMRRANRARFEREYSPEAGLDSLKKIYAGVTDLRRNSVRPEIGSTAAAGNGTALTSAD